MGNAAGTDIKLHIAYISEAFTITDIDDFFFFKSKIRIVYTRRFLSVFYAYRLDLTHSFKVFSEIPETVLYFSSFTLK